MQTENTDRICKLGSLDDWELENDDQDLRGRTLITLEGDAIGRVDDMLVNLDEERVVALRLDDDRMIDVDYVDIRDGKPVLLVPRASIPPAPAAFDRDNLTTEHVPVIEERLEIDGREVEIRKVPLRQRAAEGR